MNEHERKMLDPTYEQNKNKINKENMVQGNVIGQRQKWL